MSEAGALFETRPLDPGWRAKRLLAGTALGAWAALAALAPDWRITVALVLPLFAAALVWWTAIEPARWILLFFGAALLLPPLPLPWGDAGPHPSLAVAALGGWIALLRLREWRPHWTAEARAMALMFVVLLTSAAPAAVLSGPAIAAGTLARVGLFSIGLFVFFYAAQGPGRAALGSAFQHARYLFAMAALAALFACVDFYYQLPAPAGFGPQFVWLDSGVYRRAQGLFYEASTLGNFCVFFLVMVAVALLGPRADSPVPRSALVAGGAVLSAALVFSYSRASVLNLAVAITALLVLKRDRILIRRVAAIVAVLALTGAAVASWLLPAFADVYFARLEGSVRFFFSETSGVLSGRIENWRAVLSFLAGHPWCLFTGIGYKTLPYTDLLGRPVVADNMYLSLLVETGMVGLAALLALHGAVLSASWRAARSADRHASFFGAWFFCFWLGQTVQMASGDLLTYWRVLPLYFWALAMTTR